MGMQMEKLAYFSKTPGIGGMLKSEPEHFCVEEISQKGEVFAKGEKVSRQADSSKPQESASRFTHFILEKRNWNTNQALGRIADELHIGVAKLSCAGTKDRTAISTQLCSAFRIEPEKLLSLHIKDISINGAWGASKPVEMGDLLGNRFTIKVEGAKVAGESASGNVERIASELNGKIVNYFGEQRFGSNRRNTHLVGADIVRNDFKRAIENYLSFIDEREDEEARMARKNLADTQDYQQALKEFPGYLKYERTLLGLLAENPYDYVNAMRKLPRTLSLMFVHAFQSQLLNELLSERVKEEVFDAEEGEYYCKENSYGFPDIEAKSERNEAGKSWLVCKIIGFETKESDISEREKKILEKYELTPASFKIKSFPELSSKGSARTFFTPIKDFAFEPTECVFKFELSAGSYATIVMREFLDLEK